MHTLPNTPKNYYNANRKELTQLLPHKYSKVLEIGCAEGDFRANLTQNNEYWGVEPALSAAKIAEEKVSQVLVGTYDEVIEKIPNNYFDLVICNDVIEHMSNHDAFLQSIKSKIVINGCLIASIPNVRHVSNLFKILIQKDWQYQDSGILDRTHLRFFTEKSLKHTLVKNDYFIEEFIGLNTFTHSSIFVRIISVLTALILGQDIKYLQFGIRIRPNN